MRTANYSYDARKQLGVAVARARAAAGHRWRPSFARAAGIGVRSLELIEQGEPGVGQSVLEAIGRALPNWTEDTPGAILEGGPIPSTKPLDDETIRLYAQELRDEYEEAMWSVEDASEGKRWEAIFKRRIRMAGQQQDRQQLGHTGE